MLYSKYRHAVLLVILAIAIVPVVSAAPKAEIIEFWDDREPSSLMQVNHDAWQEILTAYVNDKHASGVNLFDYAAVTPRDSQKLKNYLDFLQKMEPRQLNGQEAKAYWINMFNAILIDRLIDAYQSGSNRAVKRLLKGGVRNIGWGRNAAEVSMQELSLNDIEHGILRPIWKDPRIHFVISACTLSGASLLKTAFNGDNNEALLEKATADFLAHPRAVSVEDGRITLNSVFDWYASDFGDNKAAILSYVRENTSDSIRQSMRGLTRTRYDYNWALNSQDAFELDQAQ